MYSTQASKCATPCGCHAQDRQHDRRRLGRRHHQRQQRHRNATQGAAEVGIGIGPGLVADTQMCWTVEGNGR